MAIYTLQNIYATNYPTLIGNEFESGAALVLDSNGFAIKADRSNVLFNSVYEQFSKFIGFASGNHQQSENFISNVHTSFKEKTGINWARAIWEKTSSAPHNNDPDRLSSKGSSPDFQSPTQCIRVPVAAIRKASP